MRAAKDQKKKKFFFHFYFCQGGYVFGCVHLLVCFCNYSKINDCTFENFYVGWV